MIGDLTKLFDSVQKASTEQEKLRRATQLDDAIENQVRALFDDPEFPRRRRTLGAIKKGFAIYDEDPIGLQTHLVRIGARRIKGDGDDELWELPAGSASGGGGGRFNWRTTAGIIGAVAALIAISASFGYGPREIARQVGLIDSAEHANLQECLDRVDGNMRKVSACYRDYPR